MLGEADVREVLEGGVAACAHPNRVEMVLVAGLWPREFYAALHTLRIVRDSRGRPRPEPVAVDGAQSGELLRQAARWLSDLLPDPPGRSQPPLTVV